MGEEWKWLTFGLDFRPYSRLSHPYSKTKQHLWNLKQSEVIIDILHVLGQFSPLSREKTKLQIRHMRNEPGKFVESQQLSLALRILLKFDMWVHYGSAVYAEWLKSTLGQCQDGEQRSHWKWLNRYNSVEDCPILLKFGIPSLVIKAKNDCWHGWPQVAPCCANCYPFKFIKKCLFPMLQIVTESYRITGRTLCIC